MCWWSAGCTSPFCAGTCSADAGGNAVICSRRVKALFTAFLALLLAGVTGFTPSVCRAAVAVWVSALGVWVYGASDALTSLAAAGILMTARQQLARV